MKQLLLLTLCLFCTSLSAQLNKKIVGKWKLNYTVSTEFKETEIAMKQVADYTKKYQYLENSIWFFKDEGILEVKLEDGKIEKGNYSANEDRFLIIFEKEEIEEFNTTNVNVSDKIITLSMGRGMTKLVFNFTKK